MTETPKCPYCGAELEVTHAFVNDATAAHKLVYTCFCRECGVYTPKRSTPEEALSAALHRAEPEMRPLTLDEVLELGKDDDSIVYITDRHWEECGWHHPVSITYCSATFEEKCQTLHFYEPGNDLKELWPEAEYGKTWRCWPRKPTPEQMAAEKWEE